MDLKPLLTGRDINTKLKNIATVNTVELSRLHPRPKRRGFSLLGDKALAIDCVLFMASALFSFLSIRLESSTRGLERWAEVIFIFGLVSMTIIAVIFSFEIV